jgi:pimeloyl-ACP methyl ester carboxylesterase
MSIRSLLINLLLLSFLPGLHAKGRPQETVVLLHGILNRPFVMKKIQRGLEKNGFRVLNWGYQSTEKTIEEYTADLKQFVESQKLTQTVHFVGFSLGSIIARNYLSTTPPPQLGRFVQIAPPNHGSQWVDHLYQFDTFRWVFGDKAIQQLKANSPFIETLGVPTCEFGIIAGGRGDNNGFNPILEGDDDGSVALSSAHLEGAKDFVRVKSEHTMLLAKDETVNFVVSFLKNGSFRFNSSSEVLK